MQSLLYAVGVGAGAVPLAAALNWVLKDGLGQLGGVLYAALLNNRFDSDPKRWRMVSAMALDLSTMLEVCTPLVPALFLPVAALANVGKNIAWLSASATRAGLHQSFATTGNLADVTGKSGSQTIASSTIGTAVGIALSPVIGTDTVDIMATFAVLAACHEMCVYKSLQSVVLPSLSEARLKLAVRHLLDPTKTAAAAEVSVLPPEQVAELEKFLPWQSSFNGAPGVQISVCPAISQADASKLLEQAPLRSLQKCRYALLLPNASAPAIRLWYADDATWKDSLLGYLHALKVQSLITNGATASASVVDEAEAWLHAPTGTGLTATRGEAIVAALEAQGWWVGQPLLERDITQRIHFDR